MRNFFAATMLIALPATLHAEPLTLDAALRLAETQAPELRGREAGIDAAESAAIAADRLPDPKLDLAIKDFPVTGPDAGRLNRDNFTMQVIGISQEFTHPAKRRARATRALAEIGIARADEAVAAQDVRLATALAWIDLFYAKKRLKKLELLDAELDDLQATVTARLASGAARPEMLSFAGWRLDLRSRALIDPEGAAVDLSGAEHDLLLVFLEHPGRVLGREQILEMGRGRLAAPSDRSVDTLVSRLRRKLEPPEGAAPVIKTVRGSGYMLAAKVGRT